MSFITGDIKHILSISNKTRYDDLSDQYNRLFTIKMFIISSLIIGFDYFNDTVSCITPSHSNLRPSFISSTCWIQGFFIYQELNDQLQSSGYYGIPRDLKLDGMYKGTKHLCKVVPTNQEICIPMSKSYYVQYQYMTFYIAALTVLYYFPYIIFRLVNSDVISLRKYMINESMDFDYIIKNYFDYGVNSKSRMRMRNVTNMVVKLLYIAVNIIAFIFTDGVLGGGYKDYGIKWVQWAKAKMSIQYGFVSRDIAKPGNQLLPPMGICEIQEAAQDGFSSLVNSNRLVCELSPHILYQYCFLVLWFIMVIGICISITGLFGLLIGYITHFICCYEPLDKPSYKLYKKLTLREREYLEYIKANDIEVYREIMARLKTIRCHMMEYDEDGLDSLRSFKEECSEELEFM